MSSDDQQLSRLARKFAFLNAIEHNGKANLGSVLGKILAQNPELRKEAGRVKSVANVEVTAVTQLSPAEQYSEFEKEFPG